MTDTDRPKLPHEELVECPECDEKRSRAHLQRHIVNVHGPEALGLSDIGENAGIAESRADTEEAHAILDTVVAAWDDLPHCIRIIRLRRANRLLASAIERGPPCNDRAPDDDPAVAPDDRLATPDAMTTSD